MLEARFSDHEAERVERQEWLTLFLSICGGAASLSSDVRGPAFFPEPSELQIAALQQLADRLRSGKTIPSSVAQILADLIDGKEGQCLFRLALVPDEKRIKKFNNDVEAFKVGLEINELINSGKNTTAAIKAVEKRGIGNRSIWRHWGRYIKAFPRKGDGLFEWQQKYKNRATNTTDKK
jgi:hypothetical protein